MCMCVYVFMHVCACMTVCFRIVMVVVMVWLYLCWEREKYEFYKSLDMWFLTRYVKHFSQSYEMLAVLI